MNIKKILLGICIALVATIGFIYFLFSIPGAAKKTLIEDGVGFSAQCPPDYLHFVNSKKLILQGSFISNKRNPVSEFSYNNQYNVWIYKFPDLYRNSIKNIVKERNASTSLTTFIRYNNVVNDSLSSNKEPISIWFASGKLKNLIDINFNLSGKDCHTIKKDDTVAYYGLKLNNFSITNSSNGINIIYMDANDKLRYNVPVELMFYKKANSIYLIIITTKGNNMVLDQGILRKLIFNN